MVSDRGCEASREHSQAKGHRRTDSCRTSRDRYNKHSSVEPIRPKGDESVDQVRSKESRGHARQARAVEMRAQGAWTTWNTTDRKLTWGDIWKYEPLRTATSFFLPHRFLANSTCLFSAPNFLKPLQHITMEHSE